MRSAIQIGSYAILLVALTAIPAVGVAARPGSAPLGAIVQAVGGDGRVDILAAGSTIYAGDRLKTEDDEKLRARLGGWQIYLTSNTLVEVGGLPNDLSVTLLSGAIVISSPDRQTFQLQADGLTILPLGTQAALAQVIWKNAHELKVTSGSGGLQLSMGAEVQTIQQGETYRIAIETENQEAQGPAGSGKGAAPAGKNHFTKYAIAGGVIATAVGTWRAFVSPCAP
jgi:hypothetical protein